MSRSSLAPDQPAEQDMLGFDRIVQAVEDRILKERTADETNPSMTVGIFGGWGSGKSSLLKQLQERIQKPDYSRRYRTIEYNPWQYQHEPNQLLPFLLTVSRSTDTGLFNHIEYGWLIVWEILRRSIFWLIDWITGGLISSKSLHESAKATIEKRRVKKTLSDETRLKEEVKKLVKKARQRSEWEPNEDASLLHWNRKTWASELIIFIDDLDRCHPSDQIVTLLEQIKLFLDLEGCLFFLACDRQVVVNAINQKFPNTGDTYLEKFIQAPLYLPKIHPTPFEALFDKLLQSSREQEPERHALWEHILPLLDYNPRKVKRLHNELELYYESLINLDTNLPLSKLKALRWLALRQCCEAIRENPKLILRIDPHLQKKSQLPQNFLKEYAIGENVHNFLRYTARQKSMRFEDMEEWILYQFAPTRSDTTQRNLIEQLCAEGIPIKEYEKNVSLRLDYADLQNGDFSEVNLMGTTFRNSNLEGANFSNATFYSVDLTNAKLENIKATDAKGLETVQPKLARTKLSNILESEFKK